MRDHGRPCQNRHRCWPTWSRPTSHRHNRPLARIVPRTAGLDLVYRRRAGSHLSDLPRHDRTAASIDDLLADERDR